MAHITPLKLVMMFHLGCIWPEMLCSGVVGCFSMCDSDVIDSAIVRDNDTNEVYLLSYMLQYSAGFSSSKKQWWCLMTLDMHKAIKKTFEMSPLSEQRKEDKWSSLIFFPGKISIMQIKINRIANKLQWIIYPINSGLSYDSWNIHKVKGDFLGCIHHSNLALLFRLVSLDCL